MSVADELPPWEGDPIEVTGPSGCSGSQPTHGFTAGCGGGAPPSMGGGGTSGGGGFGGGSGGGGGLPNIVTIPNNPNNQNTSASCDTPELAVPYAVAEVAPFMSQLIVGDLVRIQYLNGQSEIFKVICTSCSITVAPIAGTCS